MRCFFWNTFSSGAQDNSHSPDSSANSLTSQKSSYLQFPYLLSSFEMMGLLSLGQTLLSLTLIIHFCEISSAENISITSTDVNIYICASAADTCNQLSAWLSWFYTRHIHDFIHDLLHTTPHPGQPTPCPSPYPPSVLYLLIWASLFSLFLGHHVLLICLLNSLNPCIFTVGLWSNLLNCHFLDTR